MQIFFLYFFKSVLMVIGHPTVKRGMGKGGILIPLTDLILVHFCVCPKPRHGFLGPYVMLVTVVNDI